MPEFTLPMLVAAKHCDRRHSWAAIGECFGLKATTARARYLHRDQGVYPAGSMPVPCPICFQGGVRFEEQGNYATATSTDGRVRSLEDLLAACQVDLGVWQVAENGYKIGTWEGWAKNEDVNLEYEAGQATGHKRSKGVIIETLYRSEARLVRRHPVPVKPVVQPIECPVTFRVGARHSQAEGRALVGADPHFGYEWRPPRWELVPFHDRLALDVMVQLIAAIQPDVVDLAGDILDLTTLTDKYARKPAFYNTTQPAVHEAHWWLRQGREASPGSEWRVHGGNHDDRMERAMAAHMQDACELRAADGVDLPPVMSVPGLLALESLGMLWVPGYPEDITWLGEAVQVRHGHVARNRALSTVTKLLEQALAHQVTGHIHRDELVSRALFGQGGEMVQVTAYCPGCLCHIDGRVPGSNSNSNWRQGLGVIEWSGRDVSVYHVPICNGAAIWDGQRFEARDRLPDLRADLPDWNW